MQKKDFELISHTADLQLRVYGITKEELFKNALIGMFQAIKPINSSCTHKNERLICKILPIEHALTITSIDQEVLLVDFLSQALTYSDMYNEAYLGVTIQKLENSSIEALLHGITIDGFEGVEIKAVTYHDLWIKQENNVWVANIVFDI
ncbi:MAG TPA: archease [Candidatus Babeliales bacterium]|nr:archease [Candidatus Babeliales bacterium]